MPYGVTADQCRWLIGGFDWPMAPFDFVPELHPGGVDVGRIPDDAALGPMLDEGEIDAMISARHHDLVVNVYRAFCEAKDVVLQEYRTGRIFNHMDVPMPWFSDLYDHDVEVFGEDWWPYGVAANRITVDAFLRWHRDRDFRGVA